MNWGRAPPCHRRSPSLRRRRGAGRSTIAGIPPVRRRAPDPREARPTGPRARREPPETPRGASGARAPPSRCHRASSAAVRRSSRACAPEGLPPGGLARLQDEPDTQDEEGPTRQTKSTQTDPVLLGRDERLDTELGGARVESGYVVGRIPVMIRELRQLLDDTAGAPEGLAEGRRRRDPRECGEPLSAELSETDGSHPARLPALGRYERGREDGDPGRVLVDGFHHLARVPQAERAGGDDEVGPRERGERLAERPGREQVPVTPRTPRARHHDLEILPEGPVLKRIVENDRGHSELLDGDSRGLMTVRADDDGDARQPTREQKRLVTRFLRVEGDRGGVRDDLDPARAAPVAAADDRGSMAEGGERLDRHLDGRRLAGSADGQVADGDHAARQGARFQDSPSVEPFACSEQAAVATTGDGQNPRRPRPEALLPAADEAFARLHGPAPGWRERSMRSRVSRTAPGRGAAARYPAP